MKNKQTEWGTVASMTGLIGLLPLLITLGLAQHIDLSAVALAIVHGCLMVLGIWLFTVIFGN